MSDVIPKIQPRRLEAGLLAGTPNEGDNFRSQRTTALLEGRYQLWNSDKFDLYGALGTGYVHSRFSDVPLNFFPVVVGPLGRFKFFKPYDAFDIFTDLALQGGIAFTDKEGTKPFYSVYGGLGAEGNMGSWTYGFNFWQVGLEILDSASKVVIYRGGPYARF